MFDQRFDHTPDKFTSLCNIIFLDMDGVLCNPRSSLASGDIGVASYLDPVACQLVKRLCVTQNARLVISSSWRLLSDKYAMQAILSAACGGLGQYMLVNEPDNMWTTPSFNGNTLDKFGRGKEIAEWVRRFSSRFNTYVILDDDGDMDPVKDFWVKTDMYDGFGYSHYLKAEAILKGEDPNDIKLYYEDDEG